MDQSFDSAIDFCIRAQKLTYFHYIWAIFSHLLQIKYEVVDDIIVMMSLLLRSSMAPDYRWLYCCHLLLVITNGYSSKFHECV